MDKSIMCATCARYQYGFNFCTCPVFNAQPTPRPATAEPPEWKGAPEDNPQWTPEEIERIKQQPPSDFNPFRRIKTPLPCPKHGGDCDCYVRKPATAEPPEWKDDLGAWVNRRSELELAFRRHMARAICEGEADIIRGHWEKVMAAHDSARPVTATMDHLFHNALRKSVTLVAKGVPVEPDPSPLDRALSDFIERRKAKRAEVREDDLNGYIDVRDYLARAKLLKERAKALNATEDLSRAMLTPITFTARLGVKT